MKETIRYYYGLYEDKYVEKDNYAIICVEKDTFVFKKINIREAEFIKLINTLENNHVDYNRVVVNKDNSIITKFKEANYVLTKLNNINERSPRELVDDRVVFMNTSEDKTVNKWESKLDYYGKEYINIQNTLVKNLVNYYIGMAENAITLYNKANLNNIRYVISNRRVPKELLRHIIKDPTNMLIDSIGRNPSEYIKSIALNDEGSEIIDINKMVIKYQMNNDEITAFFARLLYPSYFFDDLDNYLKGNRDIDFRKYINIIKNYEESLANFLSIYRYLAVDWLKK